MLHGWHALMNKSVPSSAKQQREITMFTVLVTIKGLAKLGNIVAETMFPVMFPGVAILGNM